MFWLSTVTVFSGALAVQEGSVMLQQSSVRNKESGSPPPKKKFDLEKMEWVDVLSCADWCATAKSGWEKKCKWNRCGACEACETEPTCPNFCQMTHSKLNSWEDWKKKCFWKACRNCEKCQNRGLFWTTTSTTTTAEPKCECEKWMEGDDCPQKWHPVNHQMYDDNNCHGCDGALACLGEDEIFLQQDTRSRCGRMSTDQILAFSSEPGKKSLFCESGYRGSTEGYNERGYEYWDTSVQRTSLNLLGGGITIKAGWQEGNPDGAVSFKLLSVHGKKVSDAFGLEILPRYRKYDLCQESQHGDEWHEFSDGVAVKTEVNLLGEAVTMQPELRAYMFKNHNKKLELLHNEPFMNAGTFDYMGDCEVEVVIEIPIPDNIDDILADIKKDSQIQIPSPAPPGRDGGRDGGGDGDRGGGRDGGRDGDRDGHGGGGRGGGEGGGRGDNGGDRGRGGGGDGDRGGGRDGDGDGGRGDSGGDRGRGGGGDGDRGGGKDGGYGCTPRTPSAIERDYYGHLGFPCPYDPKLWFNFTFAVDVLSDVWKNTTGFQIRMPNGIHEYVIEDDNSDVKLVYDTALTCKNRFPHQPLEVYPASLVLGPGVITEKLQVKGQNLKQPGEKGTNFRILEETLFIRWEQIADCGSLIYDPTVMTFGTMYR